MAAPPKQYGTTPPINTHPPTKDETDRNNDMIEELKRQKCFEGPEESTLRVEVLGKLQTLAEKFVKKTCAAKGLSEHVVNNSGGKIFTFGSYRLGAYGPGSDIDTLLVGPTHISREDFFTHVPSMLAELSPPAEEVSPVPDAFVPIIRFKLQTISIDLIFAKIPSTNSVPKDMTLDNKDLLKGCDDANLRGLNGVRLTDELLSLVPQPVVFRMALRAIKLWAKARAVYGNVIGFPGGIAWAMLVARICQLYPKAISAVVVSKFFTIYIKWPWPQPILLKILEEGSTGSFRVWNPKIYASDRGHLMPVITPNYPSMCATHNVTKSTKAVIIREMERANLIVAGIMQGTQPWGKLFERQTFFTRDYRYYLRVTAAAKSAEEILKWSGLVESKLRHLVGRVEQVEPIKLAHPFNKSYDQKHVCDTEEDADRAADGDFIASGQQNGVLTQEANLKQETEELPKPTEEEEGKITVYTNIHYIGLEIDIEKAKQIDLSWACHDFYNFCKTWPDYSEDKHRIKIGQIRNTQLPDDVFLPGETRPARPAKKRKVVVKKKGPKDEINARIATNGADVLKKRSAELTFDDSVKRQRMTPSMATNQA